MMKRYLCLAVAIIASPAGAVSLSDTIRATPKHQTADGLLIDQSDAELAEWRQQALRFNLNCPNPLGLFDEGENEYGIIWRLKCSAKSGEMKSWNLQIIFRPASAPVMTKWPDRQP